MNQMELKRKRYVILGNLLWLINLLVLSNLIGEHGVGYLAAAIEVYILCLVLTSYTMPEAMAKLIRIRMQKGQYKNAIKVFQCALILGVIYSLIGGAVLYLFADAIMGNLLGTAYAAFTLKIFIPAFIVFSFIQAFRGYFQGIGSVVPTIISKIMEAIIILGTSLIFCYLLIDYGKKVADLTTNKEFIYSYGSVGVAVSFFIAMMFLLLFLFFIYQTNKRGIRANVKETSRAIESYSGIGYSILASMLPFIIIELIYRIPVVLGMMLFKNDQLTDGAILTGNYGAFYGKYKAIVFLFVMIIQLLTVSIEAMTITSYRKQEGKIIKEKFAAGIHQIICNGVFYSVMLAILGGYLVKGLYKYDSGLTQGMFLIGSSVILFASLSLFMGGVLIGIGKLKQLIINLGIGLILFIGLGILTIQVGKMGIRGVVLSWLAFWIVLSLANFIVLMRTFSWVPEWIYLLAIPIGTSALTGIIMMLLSKALVSLVGDITTFLICFVIGAIGNLTLLLALHGIKEQELKVIPGGKLILKFAKLVHFL